LLPEPSAELFPPNPALSDNDFFGLFIPLHILIMPQFPAALTGTKRRQNETNAKYGANRSEKGIDSSKKTPLRHCGLL